MHVLVYIYKLVCVYQNPCIGIPIYWHAYMYHIHMYVFTWTFMQHYRLLSMFKCSKWALNVCQMAD